MPTQRPTKDEEGIVIVSGLRKSVGLVVAAALWLTIVPAAGASQTVVDTRDDANVEFISSFGRPNTATYGQTVTVPAGTQTLTGFTFRLHELPSGVLFRGFVYAWDPAAKKAVGPQLYESDMRTPRGKNVQDVTFDTGAVPVTPGGQYVLFASVSKDFEDSVEAPGRFRSTKNTAYPDGQFVFLNNGTDEAQWTANAWGTVPIDLQFRASFAPPQALTVTKSGNGSGTVTSSGAGINCGADCSEGFLINSFVALQAVPDAGSVFVGFSGGGCSTSPCSVKMSDDQTIGAVFADVTAPQTTIFKRKGGKIWFKSSEENSTFKCKLDKGKWKSCKSPYVIKNAEPGKHKFRVAATDAAGNRDTTPAKLKFTLG